MQGGALALESGALRVRSAGQCWRCVQGEDVQRTVALMEAKIRRLQGIITRSQPQEELNLRTIQSLEQVLLDPSLCMNMALAICGQQYAAEGHLVLRAAEIDRSPYAGPGTWQLAAVFGSWHTGRARCLANATCQATGRVVCRMQELAMMRGGSGAVPRRTASQLPRQPTLDKGHIRASSHMQRTSSMPASYGRSQTLQAVCGLTTRSLHPFYCTTIMHEAI